MVEETIDLVLVDQHEFVVKADFDENLKGLTLALSFLKIMT